MATVLAGTTRRRGLDRQRLEAVEQGAEQARRGERWHPWPARGWPCTTAEERRFVDALADRAADLPDPAEPPVEEYGRRDVTALLNALRCGLTVESLLRHAPGLSPRRLLAAHRVLEGRRASAEYAWQRIVASPASGTLAAYGPDAAVVLPVVVGRLLDRFVHGDDDLAVTIAADDAEIRRVARIAESVEDWLDDPAATAERKRKVGLLLHHLDEPGIWSHDHYLVARVGALVPVRLAALLGERTAVAARSR